MFVAFVKDEPVQLDAMLMVNYKAFEKNASIIGSMHQVGSVKPQPALGTGWLPVNKLTAEPQPLNTDAVMYMYKVGQTGQVYNMPGACVFVGQSYVDALHEYGLDNICKVAEGLILAGATYSADDGRLSPLQIMAITLSVQVVGMDEHKMPSVAATADLDGNPAIIISCEQMTMNAMTYTTMMGQQNVGFAGKA